MPSLPQIRRIVLTGSIAAITATGAIYGAGLKTRQERAQKVAALREATLEERCAQLESRRESLMAKKMGLERKIDELESRISGKGSKVEMGRERT